MQLIDHNGHIAFQDGKGQLFFPSDLHGNPQEFRYPDDVKHSNLITHVRPVNGMGALPLVPLITAGLSTVSNIFTSSSTNRANKAIAASNEKIASYQAEIEMARLRSAELAAQRGSIGPWLIAGGVLAASAVGIYFLTRPEKKKSQSK